MAIRPVGHEDRLSLVEHLDELRTRLVACVLVFFACFAFTYWQNDRLLDLVNAPLEQTQNLECEEPSTDSLEQSSCFQRLTARALRQLDAAAARTAAALEALGSQDELPARGERALAQATQALRDTAAAARRAVAAAPTNPERQPVTLGVAEPFLTTFTVAAYGALLLALPFLLFQAYAFVLPAFTRDERRVVMPLMLMVPVLFVAGVAFGYFVALPRAVDFLQNFNDDAFDILVSAREYYKFSVLFLAMVGLLFQIPVGVLAVTRLGVVSTRTLRRNRGYVLLGIAVVCAIATPTPDPITMLLAMGPLVVLFELSVQLARLFEPKDGTVWSWNDDDDDELD